MKNFRLITKLQILALIMILSAVFVGGVGYLSLNQMQGTFAKLLAAESAQEQTLFAIRAQKNAVLAITDKDSIDYASASRESMKLADLHFVTLDGLVSNGSDEEKLLKTVRSTFASFADTNKTCLAFAEQNTNLKAAVIFWGPIKTDVAVILKLTDKLAETPAKDETNTSKRKDDAYRLTREILLLQLMLKQHIEKAIGVDISTLERSISESKMKVEQLVEEALSLTNPDESALRAPTQVALSDFNFQEGQLIKLSKEDSNNKSLDISLNEAKVKFDAFSIANKDLLQKLIANSNETASFGRMMIVIAALMGMSLKTFFAWLIAKSVTKPVALVRDFTKSMAGGELTERMRLTQQDEIGELARSTDSLADSLTGIVSEMSKTGRGLEASSASLEKISKELVTVSDQASTQSASVAAAAEQLSANISAMSSAAEEMSVSFASISSATEEMSVNVGSISSAAEQTSSNVAVVASAVQDITGSFSDVLTDVREGARVASQASQLAHSATKTMKELNQAGGEISKVTETIKMIALQTNLLALNATIEATSAGEAGKGFAVVAHEIKELANQSAKAAEDIARKIEGVQTGTRDAVGVIQEVADVIKAINASADRISHSVENQTKAAQTISQNVTEANKGVGQIARSIAEVATTANDMSRNVSEAARGANDVSRSVQESAQAARGISSSIITVSEAARATNGSATGVTAASENLSQIATQLKKLVARFKIPGNVG